MRHVTKRCISFMLLIMILVMSVPNVTPAQASSELALVGGFYEIKTENDFKLIKDMSASYKIIADITLTDDFEPIGTYQTPFKGKLFGARDGKNNEKPVITIKTDNYSGIVGYLNGGQIKNIEIAGDIKTNDYVVGGIVDTAKSGKIANCVNSADITVTYNGANKVYVGGIIGKTETPNNLTLSGCENNGDITLTTSEKGYVGGIAGRVVFAYESGEFDNCINTGKIEASTENVGGIAGNLYTQLPATNLYNEGEVISTHKAGYVGGVVGTTQGSISRAYNTAKITGKNVAAGIIGKVIANDSYTYDNSYNAGEITANKTVAGILAEVDGNKSQKISTSYNAGELKEGVAYAISPLNNVVNANNFYLADSTAINSMISPMTEEDMKDLNHFNGFSSDLWVILEDSEYPYPQFKSDMLSLDAGYLYVEAEDSIKIATEASVVNDSEVSGGKYVRFTKNHRDVDKDNPGIEDPMISVKFLLNEKKTVTVYTRIRPASGDNDNYWRGFDGELVHAGAATYGVGFYWEKEISQELEPGVHTFDFYPRERNEIDNFYFTTEPMYMPTGLNSSPDAPIEPVTFHKEGSLKPLVEGHPRVYITKEDIPTIRENLTHPQNANMYARHLNNIANTSDGTLSDASNNTDARLLEAIESKALQYVLFGEQEYGYAAINSIVNYIGSWNMATASTSDLYSLCGEVIHKLSIVYDWCYDLLTEADKEKFYKLFTYLCSGLEIGYPPTPQQWLVGHGSETQMWRDYLAAAIAFYDDYPFLYDGVSGVVVDEMMEYRKWFYQGHIHPEGDGYTNVRFGAEVAAMLLLDGIGYPQIFGPDQQYVPYWHMYARRPDGPTLRNSDSTQDTLAQGEYRQSPFEPIFLIASYFNDPYLKEEAMRSNVGFYPVEVAANRSLSPTEFLIFNDPTLDGTPSENLPLTKYFPSPQGEMIARTGWDYGLDSNTVVANMKIKEWYMNGHSHMDSGAFQIYYKGALATDSGYYQNSWGYDSSDGSWGSGSNANNNGNTYYGSLYFYNYSRRTAAHNSMLVYDPDEVVYGDYARDGGQRFIKGSAPSTYSEFLRDYDTEYKRGETLAHEFGLDPMEPNYTYLKGDLSYAYTDKVSEFERSFMFLNLKNDEVPAVMMVFDHVVSSNPAFKKTWLLHTIDEEPQNEGTHTVVTNTREGYNGKLTLDTLLPQNPTIKIEAGNISEGINYITIPTEGGLNESTGYMIQVSPSEANNEDYFLNVMQISDADSEAPALEVTMIDAGSHTGAKIYDRVVLFGKAKDRVKSDVTFEFTGEGTYEITVADLNKGTWKVTKDGSDYAEAVVTEEGGVGVINGAAGKYTLTFVSEEGEREEYTSSHTYVDDTYYIKNSKGVYQYSEGFVENGITIVPADEAAKIITLDYTLSADGRAVTYNGYGKTTTITADSNQAICSSGNYYLNTVPRMVDGRLFLPLREIAENHYQTVTYEAYPGVISLVSRASVPQAGYATIIDCEWIANLETTNGYSAFDGNTATGWATAAAGTDNCEITFDFGSSQPVSAIEVCFSNPHKRTFKYDILVSNDKTNWTTVVKDGESVLGTAALEWQTIGLGGTQSARYIKYVGKGNSGSNANNILEIKFKN